MYFNVVVNSCFYNLDFNMCNLIIRVLNVCDEVGNLLFYFDFSNKVWKWLGVVLEELLLLFL